MWKSLDEQRDDMAFVIGNIRAILDAMRPNEVVDFKEFREAVHSLCDSRVSKDDVEAGIMRAIEDHLIEFTKFMLEVRAGDDTWDNTLSAILEDDSRWVLTVNRNRPVRKVA